MRLPHGIATAVLVLAMVAAPARAVTPLVPVDPHFQDEPVLENLDSPVAVRFAPPPDGRIFVAEKSGLVEAFDGPGDTTPAIVVDLRDEVDDFWDRGLLGMALDPAFATNGRLYLLYTRDKPIGGTGPPYWGDTCPDPPGATEDGCVVSGALVRVTVDALGLGGDVTPLVQEQWCQQFPSHSVGTVAFGPDGMLYAGAGDGASFTQPDYGQLGGNPCGDPEREGGSLRAQDIRTPGDPTGLDGAIVRVDPATGAHRIVGYGLRNPFRFAFRPGTSEIWIGDVGDARWEEIDRVADPGADEPPNFGWPCFEGAARHPRWTALQLPLCTSLADDDVTPPVYQYPHHQAFVEGGDCAWSAGASVSGIAFHGADGGYPARYDGSLFFSDYSLGCIFAMRAGKDGAPDPRSVELFARPAATDAQAGGPVELQTGPGGDLYYPLYDPEDPGSGSVRRIRYVPGNLPPRAAIAADRTQGDVPLTVSFSAAGSSDPDGDALSYEWDLDGDGAFDDGIGPAVTRTYTAIGTVRAGVRVSDPDGASGTAFVTVSAGNTAPAPVIDTPSASQRWAVGEPVAFHGSASDAEDGPLPASALRWVLALEHCTGGASGDCHSHPLEQRDGVDGGLISGPEHDYPSRLVLRLIATDSRGLTGEATMRLDPRPAVVTASTDPPGGTVDVDGVRGTSVQRTVIAGSRVTVATDPVQELGGNPRAFAGWSDGELAASRTIRPAADVTLVARFATATAPGGATGHDHIAPRLRVLWPRSHRIDRRSVAVRVRCSEACALSPRAWLVASGRRMRLPARVHGHTRVVIHLTATARSRARRAMRDGRSARIRVEVVARDAAGNRACLRRALRLG